MQPRSFRIPKEIMVLRRFNFEQQVIQRSYTLRSSLAVQDSFYLMETSPALFIHQCLLMLFQLRILFQTVHIHSKKPPHHLLMPLRLLLQMEQVAAGDRDHHTWSLFEMPSYVKKN